MMACVVHVGVRSWSGSLDRPSKHLKARKGRDGLEAVTSR